MLWKVRNTAGEVESNGQSSASMHSLRIPRRVYVRTYIRPRTYTFVRSHMRGHEQHLQTRSGSPHISYCDVAQTVST